jgi:hypothetical protein
MVRGRGAGATAKRRSPPLVGASPAAGAADGEDEAVDVADVTAAVRTAARSAQTSASTMTSTMVARHEVARHEKNLHAMQGLTPFAGALTGARVPPSPMETAPLARDMSFGSRAGRRYRLMR